MGGFNEKLRTAEEEAKTAQSTLKRSENAWKDQEERYKEEAKKIQERVNDLQQQNKVSESKCCFSKAAEPCEFVRIEHFPNFMYGVLF